MNYFIIIITLISFFALDTVAQVKTTDSTFVQNSRPIQFIVNRMNISDQDREWITKVLIPQLEALGDRGIVLGRATASPEGPYDNNCRLAKGRCASVDRLLSSYGISTNRIRYDVVPEDYGLLHTLMYISKDKRFHEVDSLINQYGFNTARLKEAMKRYDGGKLWRYVLKEYFPLLRAVRIMAIDKRNIFGVDDNSLLSKSLAIMPTTIPNDVHLDIPTFPFSNYTTLPRRELLSVKTNLLLDLAYMPGYDRFCPIPNVAIEYYPLHGHLTYGASFDGPWWQHYDEHKYFQLRNYQIHTRYYLRSGDIRERPLGQGAAFKGLYFSLYAHAYLYNISKVSHPKIVG